MSGWRGFVRHSGLDFGEPITTELTSPVLFWIRPTKVTLINVPYTSQKKHEVHFVVDLAIYDANILGARAWRTAAGHRLPLGDSENSQYFHDATCEVEEAYLKLAKEVRDEC